MRNIRVRNFILHFLMFSLILSGLFFNANNAALTFNQSCQPNRTAVITPISYTASYPEVYANELPDNRSIILSPSHYRRETEKKFSTSDLALSLHTFYNNLLISYFAFNNIVYCSPSTNAVIITYIHNQDGEKSSPSL